MNSWCNSLPGNLPRNHQEMLWVKQELHRSMCYVQEMFDLPVEDGETLHWDRMMWYCSQCMGEFIKFHLLDWAAAKKRAGMLPSQFSSRTWSLCPLQIPVRPSQIAGTTVIIRLHMRHLADCLLGMDTIVEPKFTGLCMLPDSMCVFLTMRCMNLFILPCVAFLRPDPWWRTRSRSSSNFNMSRLVASVLHSLRNDTQTQRCFQHLI